MLIAVNVHKGESMRTRGPQRDVHARGKHIRRRGPQKLHKRSSELSRHVAPSASDAKKAGRKAKWNFMVYMAANNDLADAASDDLKEITNSVSNGDIKVFVFLHQKGKRARRIEIGAHGRRGKETILGTVDSGDPQTVLDFVRWAVRRAPADRYALVLWNHGRGWQPGDLDQLYKRVRGINPPKAANMPAQPSASGGICEDHTTRHSLDTIE